MLIYHMHSTEILSRAHIDSLEFSTVRSGFWPSAPLVEWSPALLEFYFDTLEVLVRHEGVSQ